MDHSVNTGITTLKILYAALMAGVLLFLTVSLVLNYLSGPFMPGQEWLRQIFLLVAILLAVTAVFGGIAFVRKKLADLPPALSPEDRMNNYRSLMIIRAALMEGPAFFFIV
jgi:hypothetical protein